MSVILGPRCNRQVTCDTSPSNDRSESSIAANPLDPFNLVGSSKRFTNPATYEFSLAAYTSFDGGLSWIDSGPLPLLPGWTGTSDPAVAWDSNGGVYLVALPFGPGVTMPIVGIAVYRSADGGRNWEQPTLIHASGADDKQGAAGDNNSASPYFGNVYAAWDDGNTLRFARTTDNGSTWRGAGPDPAGTALANDSFAPALAVAPDGTLYIVWVSSNETQIKFIKSSDGGDSFSQPAIAADGIRNLDGAGLRKPDGFPELPGGQFRVSTIATACAGRDGEVVIAWADYRDGHSQIYYCKSADGGTTWSGSPSGQALLTGPVASSKDKHDFQPQLASTPAGEIGCAFYEFGPIGGGEFPPSLINVCIAVSIDHGTSFTERATVTEQPWDPRVDAPFAHGSPNTTFIGDYFGLAASSLGFFPLFISTITGVQEMFTARVSVNPADLYIRDSSLDNGDVPSPGYHWEAPDLIVRRQPDGDTTFVNQDILRDGVTDHYIYGRVTNRGPNEGRNVRLSVVVGNYPTLLGLPGAEFRYPQDWYAKDWTTSAIQNNHINLGESPRATVPNGRTKILGPLLWPASQIPPLTTWHPCLLAEVRADNDDSAGGVYGCGIPANTNPCDYGFYFWGNNNVCQRNLTYAKIPKKGAARIHFPFILGSVWSTSRFLEVTVEKPANLAKTRMVLHIEPITLPDGKPGKTCTPGEIVFTSRCRVIVRSGHCDLGEFITEPGASWSSTTSKSKSGTVHGGQKGSGQEWTITERRGAVGLPVVEGELLKATLSFTTPTTLKAGSSEIIRIYQKNDRKSVVGSVSLQLDLEK
ncbi:hypothetical protein QWA68_016806 [Fusarium oxysporum]|nr:hypothetical protein QWA68_016806 [Fusarium oxysporum]